MNPRSMLRNLSSTITLDDYLLTVSKKTPSHAFLGHATLGIYQRMVNMLENLYAEVGREPATVRVLDWGCGKGHITYLLKQKGFDVVSCDVSCDIHSKNHDSYFAQQTPIIKDQHIDVVPLTHDFKLPFADLSFDCVVGFGVLEHVRYDEKSLTEIRRILKAGGYFYFSFLPYWLSWTQRLAHWRGNFYHDHLYTEKKVYRLARRAGFSVEVLCHGQLLPKNSWPHINAVEKVDRFLTTYTPLKYFSTNLEGLMHAVLSDCREPELVLENRTGC